MLCAVMQALSGHYAPRMTTLQQRHGAKLSQLQEAYRAAQSHGSSNCDCLDEDADVWECTEIDEMDEADHFLVCPMSAFCTCLRGASACAHLPFIEWVQAQRKAAHVHADEHEIQAPLAPLSLSVATQAEPAADLHGQKLQEVKEGMQVSLLAAVGLHVC